MEAAAVRGEKPAAEGAGVGPELGQTDAHAMCCEKRSKASSVEGAALELTDDYHFSITRACQERFYPSGWYYRSKAKDSFVIRKRMQEIAQVRIRYGFWRIFILLRWEG